MKINLLDLSKKPQSIIKALDRREEVTVIHHGKVVGFLVPVKRKKKKRMTEHPFFGMYSKFSPRKSVLDEVNKLREVRYDDI